MWTGILFIVLGIAVAFTSADKVNTLSHVYTDDAYGIAKENPNMVRGMLKLSSWLTLLLDLVFIWLVYRQDNGFALGLIIVTFVLSELDVRVRWHHIHQYEKELIKNFINDKIDNLDIKDGGKQGTDDLGNNYRETFIIFQESELPKIDSDNLWHEFLRENKFTRVEQYFISAVYIFIGLIFMGVI